MYKKRGITTIFLTLGIMLVIIILFVSILIYASLNIVSRRIKKDITYIVTNGINAYDKEGLALEQYNVDIIKLEKDIQELLNKNHITTKSIIKDIEIKELKVIYEKQKIEESNFKVPSVMIKIVVKIRPIFNMLKKEYIIVIEDKIKLALLEYKEEK